MEKLYASKAESRFAAITGLVFGILGVGSAALSGISLLIPEINSYAAGFWILSVLFAVLGVPFYLCDLIMRFATKTIRHSDRALSIALLVLIVFSPVPFYLSCNAQTLYIAIWNIYYGVLTVLEFVYLLRFLKKSP